MLKHALFIFTSPAMLLFDRCRGSVEISAQQLTKLAYVHAHCARVNKESFHEKVFNIASKFKQLFVFYSYSGE